MPKKNPCFQEWIEKFNRLVDQSIAELRGIKVRAKRVRGEKDKIKWYSFPRQVIRRDIIRSLILPYEEASVKHGVVNSLGSGVCMARMKSFMMLAT